MGMGIVSNVIRIWEVVYTPKKMEGISLKNIATVPLTISDIEAIEIRGEGHPLRLPQARDRCHSLVRLGVHDFKGVISQRGNE
jgi:hypothetical protein